MRHCACIVLGILLGVFGAWTAPVRGEVHVVEDEVIFTVHAPDARRVFLVGNFNNWNPTVEPMAREGEQFTASLFLAADEYYYKFVVDGVWMSDPDNPPTDPEKGSPLVLVERGGALSIKELSGAGETRGAALLPAVRYIGRATSEDGDADAAQEVDFLFDIDTDIARNKIILKTRDNTWTASPLGVDVTLDRGRLALQAAGGTVTGFENDSTWSSTDPFGLFGNVGIHDYTFGFGRRGVTIEQRILSVELDAVYSNRPGGGTRDLPSIPEDRVAAVLASPSARPIAYETVPGLDGEDTFGWNVKAVLAFAEIGYGARENRGMNAGLLARFDPGDSVTQVSAFNTREEWKGSVVWFRSRIFGPVYASAGLGGGDAWIRRLSRSSSAIDHAAEVTLGSDTDPDGARVQFQKSKRWNGDISLQTDRLVASLGFERSTFEFSAPVFDPSKADIRVTTLDLAYGRKAWRTTARVQDVEQDYGATPRDFHFFTGERNFWLDYGDRLTVENMVGFDLRSFFSWTVAVSRNRITDAQPGSSRAAGEPSFGFWTGGVVDGKTEAVRYLFARGAYERFIKAPFYAQADARIASYPQAGWSNRRTFGSVYIESGYRSGHMELSLGFGFDPVVFDRVSNEYADIGRIEFLRGAAEQPLLRGAYTGGEHSGGDQPAGSGATELEYRLLGFEESLQKNTSLKLEWIVVF